MPLSQTDSVCFQVQIDMIVVAASYVHSKLTEFFFLLRFELAFDRLVIELAAHLVKVSVQVQTSIARSKPATASGIPLFPRWRDCLIAMS